MQKVKKISKSFFKRLVVTVGPAKYRPEKKMDDTR